jgi:DNA-binding PadR family transcriptional regulator
VAAALRSVRPEPVIPPAQPRLTTTDAAVLAALCEGDAHGFRVAGLFSREGDLGAIWTLQRTQIYRALDRLERASLIVPVRLEVGAAGPARTVYRTTPAGRVWVAAWLATPVTRLREGRNDLRLKLAFWLRSGDDPRGFLEAQRGVFQALFDTLSASLPTAERVTRMSLLWRLEMAGANLRFIEARLAECKRSPT